MSGGYGIVGCGYVGSAVAVHLRHQGHEVVGTTTSPGRLAELCDLVDHPRLYSAGDPMADTSFLDRLDGVLIAMAPTTATFEEDQYEKVYGQAVPALVDAIRQRQEARPLHVTYLSSAGIYGDQSGAICNELTSGLFQQCQCSSGQRRSLRPFAEPHINTGLCVAAGWYLRSG